MADDKTSGGETYFIVGCFDNSGFSGFTAVGQTRPDSSLYCPGLTASPASNGCQDMWIGDGHCDDDNNNAGCSYDGGDCCGDDVSMSYCSVCQCLDPAYFITEATASSGCSDAWIGDGQCDDDNNNAACSYDGGDCCGDTIIMSYCSACQCLDPDYTHHPTEATVVCMNPQFIGDGYCDDHLNIHDCTFDGGDCCGPAVLTDYCSDCQCLDSNYFMIADAAYPWYDPWSEPGIQ